MLFAFLGLLALVGLIAGLLLLLNAHRDIVATPKVFEKVKNTYVDPKLGKVVEEISVVPVTP